MEELSPQLSELWTITLEVWNTGVFGYSIGDALVALGIFLAFYLLRGFFARFVFSFLDRWVKNTSTKFDDYLHSALIEPLRFGFVIVGVFFALDFLNMQGTAAVIADNVIRSLIAFAIFWALHNAINPLSMLLRELGRMLTNEMLNWLITGAKWGIIAIGAATILQIWGIQVAPIIAGLGLFGVAVALGAQDLFKNLIGGLSILIEKRFRAGDWIMVDGVVEGTVEHVGFRSTRVRRFDQAPVFVPNQKLSDAAVTNFSDMTYRRIFWKIGVEYRTTLDQLKEIRDGIETYLRENDNFVQPPAAAMFVRIDAFGASSIDIMLYTFTYTTVWGEWLEQKEELAFKVKEIVEGAGTGFAFPSQSLYVEKWPEGTPEPFVPPSEGTPNAEGSKAVN
ncbi:mechanosensitive ion channel family protein [Tepidicaulis sp. LMO-SS28]|uniref:mechanosensitive ion channel family protein n=1 Tax=Tepidicaulis sp. LMO-SS28 TaxID=3447455 RepID=UPI003EE33CC3